MDAYTREVLTKFGSSNYAQAVLGIGRTKLNWMIEKYGIDTPTSKEVNENVAAFMAQYYKASQ